MDRSLEYIDRLEVVAKDIERTLKERTDAVSEAYDLLDRLKMHLRARDDYDLSLRDVEFVADLEVLLDEADKLTGPTPVDIHKNCISLDANKGADVCALCGWKLSEEERAEAARIRHHESWRTARDESSG